MSVAFLTAPSTPPAEAVLQLDRRAGDLLLLIHRLGWDRARVAQGAGQVP